MASASVTQRAEVDRCPGVLRPHRAADGALLRLRLPGGELKVSTLDIISRAAVRYADGALQLTSRANLQLRGVATDDRGAVHPGLVDEIVRAGLLPHPSHERVRNIVCSPLTGRRGGLSDLRQLLGELDDLLCATEQLAALPGPFLFVLDDGRGDVVSAGDLGVLATGTGTVQLVLGGLPVGPGMPLAGAADALITLAVRFLDLARGGRGRWHVRDLPGGAGDLLDLLPDLQGRPHPEPRLRTMSAPVGLGAIEQDDGRVLVSTLAPLGLLNGEQAAALVRAAGSGAGDLIVTPWLGVIVPDLPTVAAAVAIRDLAAVGLAVDDGTAWRGLTACAGAPRCTSGRGDTRALATRIATWCGRSATSARPAPPVHVVGCDRRCGSPSGAHVEVLATTGRAVVRGVAADHSEPARSTPGGVNAVDTAAVDAAAAAFRADLNAVEAGER
jgi:precorrin-3B synthase